MKNLKLNFLTILLVVIIFATQSCSKDTEKATITPTVTDDYNTQTQQASDEATMTSETESALKDMNDAMENSNLGKTFSIAGATLDSNVADKKCIINYNGYNADGNRFRTGQITMQLTSGAHWSDQGAVLIVTFNNFKVTRNTTGKSLIINGTHIITNVSGGMVRNLMKGSEVIHRVTGGLNITLEDGTQRTWQIYRQRSIGISALGLAYVTLSGFGVNDSANNVVVSGTNRAGKTFYTVITTPLYFSSACGWTATSGVKIHKGITKEIMVTFGVDASGNPITVGCPFGYKLNWTNTQGVAKQAIFNY